MTNNELKSKERILKAALEIFAEIGYDAARVDEIANAANVKKPLIYYYFKSKQDILEALIDNYLKEIVNDKQHYIKSMKKLDVESLNFRFDEKVPILKNNKKYLKIIALEILKNSDVSEAILNRIKPIMVDLLPKFKEIGINIEDKERLAITYFFFGMAPALMLTLFGDRFCEIYHIHRTKLESEFNSLFKDFYIKSVGNMLFNSTSI